MRYAILVLFLLFPIVVKAQKVSGPKKEVDEERDDEFATGFRITTSGKELPLKYTSDLSSRKQRPKNYPIEGIIGPRGDYSNAELSGADLFDTSLTRANLTNANLVGCNLQLSDLTQANLQGAILSKANLMNADLSGANISGTILKKIKYLRDHTKDVKGLSYAIESLEATIDDLSGLPETYLNKTNSRGITYAEELEKTKDKYSELKDKLHRFKNEHGKDSASFAGAWYHEDDPPILPRDFPEELKKKIKIVKRKGNDKG